MIDEELSLKDIAEILSERKQSNTFPWFLAGIIFATLMGGFSNFKSREEKKDDDIRKPS